MPITSRANSHPTFTPNASVFATFSLSCAAEETIWQGLPCFRNGAAIRPAVSGSRISRAAKTLLASQYVSNIVRAVDGATEDEMKKLWWMAGIALTVAFMALPVLAQDAAKKTPPKPAPSPSQALLESWNDIGRKLIAIAEDLPEDKYGYKPHPDSRTFVGNLLHASASMYFFTDTALGKKARYGDDPKRDDLKTKAQVVAFVKQCVQDGADL